MHEEAGKAGAPDRQQQAKPGRRRGKPSRSKTAHQPADFVVMRNAGGKLN
jgi:hypothetical protein